MFSSDNCHKEPCNDMYRSENHHICKQKLKNTLSSSRYQLMMIMYFLTLKKRKKKKVNYNYHQGMSFDTQLIKKQLSDKKYINKNLKIKTPNYYEVLFLTYLIKLCITETNIWLHFHSILTKQAMLHINTYFMLSSFLTR